MTDETWMTSDELRGIAAYCDALQPIWDALMKPIGGVSLESERFEFTVYDADGEKFGHITWGDSGPAFFPQSPTAEEKP